MDNELKTVASFFAGVGGIDFGFENEKNFKVIYANELDKFARETYEANFDLKVDPRDIREVSEQEVPKSNILLAGFPCQPFSVAGYRKGFEDERGSLFFDTLRMIISCKPEVIFLENVKNMVNHDKGNTFKVIRESLEVNGYYLKWAVLNAKDYGNIPQNRERIYIVGFSSKTSFEKFKFPTPVELSAKLEDFIDYDEKKDDKYYYTQEKNPTFYHELEKAIIKKDTVYQWRRRYVRENKSGVVPTLTANMGTGGHNVPLILSNKGIRKLTPRETFNIQGFPKDYVLPSKISDGQLYKQAGNSVSIPVIKRIARNINIALSYSEKSKPSTSTKRYSVIYTKMYGHHVGESFTVAEFQTKQQLQRYLKTVKLPIISNQEYYELVRRKKEQEFLMIIDSK